MAVDKVLKYLVQEINGCLRELDSMEELEEMNLLDKINVRLNIFQDRSPIVFTIKKYW